MIRVRAFVLTSLATIAMDLEHPAFAFLHGRARRCFLLATCTANGGSGCFIQYLGLAVSTLISAATC